MLLLVVVFLSAAAAQYCAAGMNAATQLSLLSTVDFAGSGARPECDLLMEPCTPCSDVWGLQVAGRSYAVLSVTNGLQFVDVTDPKRPVKGAWLPGCLNLWRDMKNWGTAVYAISEATSTCSCPAGEACMEHLNVLSQGPAGPRLPATMVITQSPTVPPLTQWPEGVNGSVVAVSPWHDAACDEIDNDLSGKIVLIPLHGRLMCMIDIKAQHAFDRGAIGVIIVNNVNNFISPGMAGMATVQLPIVLVQLSDGLALRDAAAVADVVVELTPNNRQVSPYYQQPEGLVIIDFSNPTTPVKTNSRVDFSSAHNVFVEETRPYLYVVGTTRLVSFSNSVRVSNGGFLIYSLAEDALNPKLIGNYSDYYVHDLFVHKCGNRFILVAAHIYDNRISILDVTDPTSFVVLSSFADTYTTGHNVVMDASCSVLYVTHEAPYAPISVWQLAVDAAGAPQFNSPWGPFNRGILAVNQFAGSMPHNVFVAGNKLWASYYEQGTAVWDISSPLQPVQEGVYLRSNSPSNDSSIWGVFPFVPSSNGLFAYSSDIRNGLQVLQLTPASISSSNATIAALGVLLAISLGAAIALGVYTFVLRRRLSYQQL